MTKQKQQLINKKKLKNNKQKDHKNHTNFSDL